MTKEEKQQLLQDLCARLPHEVKVKTPYNDAILRGIVDRKGVKTTIDYTDIVTDKQTYPIRYIKPYLRPMSSMTEEEKEQTRDLWIGADAKTHAIRLIDFYNKQHFDYRGLIPKNLAIEVTEENNPYKE